MCALGLRCCTKAFSGYSKWGLLSNGSARASHCAGFSCCRAWALGCLGFSKWGVWDQQLWCTSLVATWHVKSSQTRDQTCVPCIGRWLLNHWTTTEVPRLANLIKKWSHSVVSDSLWPRGLWLNRLLHPWDFPGKSTGVGCHFLLQCIFPTQGSNQGLLHWRQTL